jgi:hypothetical protein
MAFGTLRYKTTDKGHLFLRKGGKLIDCCCDDSELELVITYDWAGSDLPDLDTSTRISWAVSGEESQGYGCPNYGNPIYTNFVSSDDRRKNGKEQVNVKIMTAKNAREWTEPSSLNIDLYAWWYPVTIPEGGGVSGDGTGYINVKATYKNNTSNILTLNITIRRTREDGDCCSNKIATLSVNSDGTHLELKAV